jgi:peptide/nickel transport system substrate-binding protein
MIPKPLAALACCILLFAACSKVQSSRTGGPNPWTQPGVLRLGEPDEPDNINPMFGHTTAADEVDEMIFSSLLRYDANGNYIPDLALAVPTYANGGITKDGRTLTFHLRRNARWSDGAPLTAKDWMFTYDAVRNPQNNTKSLYEWDDIAWAKAPDDYTLIVHLKRVNAAILGLFAFGGSAYPPLPAHLLAKLPDLNRASFNDRPISSGPYILKHWSHGSSMTFVPNPLYWRGAPRLKEVLWKVIPDLNTLFTQLQTHEIDVLSGVPPNDIPQLSSVTGIRVTHRLIANWRSLGMNTAQTILRDRRVRLAIAEGVDWSRINQTSYRGYNQLAVSDIFPQSWAAPSVPRYPYDPAASRRLLAQAGWTMGPDGILRKGAQRMDLTISTGTNEQDNQQAEVQIQSDLHPLGIAVAIRNYPVSLLFAQDGPLYTGKYDLEWTVETNAPDPDNSALWNGKYIPPHGADTAWLNDPIVNQTSSAALETFDHAQRKALYQREETRLHELVPSVFFYWEDSYTATNSDVRNYDPAAFVADMWNCWQWQI